MKPVRAIVFRAVLVGLVPALSTAAPVTMRFHGTVDLSAFGGAPASAFEGDVTWDQTIEPEAFFPDEPAARYLIDGSPASVAATFSILGVDYSNRIEPFSRFELGSKNLLLQLFFAPPIDLDAGAGFDVGSVSMDLWSDTPVFEEVFPLPNDLSFLARLEHRSFMFVDDELSFAVLSDTLVVPEPSLTVLLMAAVPVVLSRRKKRLPPRP